MANAIEPKETPVLGLYVTYSMYSLGLNFQRPPRGSERFSIKFIHYFANFVISARIFIALTHIIKMYYKLISFLQFQARILFNFLSFWKTANKRQFSRNSQKRETRSFAY